MIAPARRLGVLGGTFDPVHWGHLDAAVAATDALGLTDLLFVPSRVPPHRPAGPVASAFHRFAMAALAVQALPHAAVSDLELRRDGPSYSADTLAALTAGGWQPAQICFIIGTDAFAEIAAWRGYPSLLDACHFVVISRTGTPVTLPDPRMTGRVADPASLTAVGPTRIVPVPAATRPVSSTAIRDALSRGLPVDALVPPPVATHIARHGLYRPGQDLASR